jgi:hypothetical protein
MKKLLKSIILTGTAFTVPFCMAAPLNDFSFKSPSFNGIGYSSHVLTIENQEHSRQEQVRKEIQSAIDKAAAEAKATNLNKFLNNLESRIYAQISQNLATAMFADNNSNSGTLNFEGNMIAWTKDASNVYLTVTDLVGNSTQITVPLGQFQFQ